MKSLQRGWLLCRSHLALLQLYGSMGLWDYGSVGLWVYGSMCLSVYGSMGLWFYVSMGLRVYGSTGLWVYGSMGLWVHGSMVYGSIGLWFYVSMSMGLWVYGSLGLSFSRFALLEYPDADRGRCAFVVPQGPLPILFPNLLRPEDRTYPFLGIL